MPKYHAKVSSPEILGGPVEYDIEAYDAHEAEFIARHRVKRTYGYENCAVELIPSEIWEQI